MAPLFLCLDGSEVAVATGGDPTVSLEDSPPGRSC